MATLAHPHTLAGQAMSQRGGATAQTLRVPSNFSKLAETLKLRGNHELDSSMSARLQSYTYDSVRDWIGTQRIIYLPPEGSRYDKVLAWAHLFVERVHSFETGIRELVGDTHLAAHLAYGYCVILLELGKENASALMTVFGFLNINSIPLANLLERVELFGVSQEIVEQLTLALSDLVTLVATVAIQFHEAIRQAPTRPVSINIYSTFSAQITSFRERCEDIAQAMWRHQVSEVDMDRDAVSDIKPIKAWLAPDDPVLTDAAVSASLLAYDREERTCLWVGSHLTRFLKGHDKILSIAGRLGCGKSIVASVIVDYLQQPISGVRYNALFIPISSTIPAESSARAVARAILGQLFEKRIGNTQLLRTLRDAYQRSKHATAQEEYNNMLWAAVEGALASPQLGARELIMVVDGVDEASCGEAALLSRLTRAMDQGSNVRLITLGSKEQAVGAGMRIQMDEDLVFDDIMAVIRTALGWKGEFSKMEEIERETTITRLTKTSAGSFLRARLIISRLSRETGSNRFRNAMNAILEKKATVNNLVSHHIQSSDITDDARLMLAWLTIAERPLSPTELETLASVQVAKGKMLDKRIDAMAVLGPVKDLVSLHDGLVYIRHGLIRSSLGELLPQLLPAVEDPHADLTTRLLLYVKLVIREQHEPSVTLLDSYDMNRLLSKHLLLPFAVRYWPVHLRKSDVFAREGDAGAARVFKHVYPTSVTGALLQASLWEHKPKPSIIFLAMLHQQVDELDKAGPLFFEATLISDKLLGRGHDVTMQLASAYIQVTGPKVTASRTDVMSNREQVFAVLLECYKTQFGPTSMQVITLMRQLVEHHQTLGDNETAQQMIETIQSITNGKPDVSGGRGPLVDLHPLRPQPSGGEGGLLSLGNEVSDPLIDGTEASAFILILKEAEEAVAEGHFDQAEGLYIELLQRLSREHRAHDVDVWAETGLQALLSYAKFLQTRQRTAEASAILVSVYKDYSLSASSAVTETSAGLLMQMAHMMRAVGLSSVALSVFKHCAEYYRATDRTQTSTYKALQQSLEVTSQEVQKLAISSETTVSETMLEEIVIEASSSFTTVSQTTLTTSTQLISRYIKQHRWQDATRVVKKMLRGMWPSLFTANAQDVTLAARQVEMCVELAGRLAQCYRVRRRVTQEEDIRVRMYRALRSGRPVGDKMRERAVCDLLAFYGRTSQHESAIGVRQENLDDYTEHYGERHPTVIRTLRELAESTRPRPVFIEYYKKMVHALTQDSDTTSPEALEPASIVATEMWNRGLFSDALPYYGMLFSAFFEAPEMSPMFRDEGWLGQCFDHYTDCLRSVRSAFSVLHRITTNYQAQCMKIYGPTVSITIHATLRLATICLESKSTEAQAVELYEKLREVKSEEIDQQEIMANLEMLQELQAIETTEVLDTTDVSWSHTETVLRKRVISVRETHGWAHEESLSQLTQLVHFYSHHSQVEEATRELRETATQVLSTKTKASSTQLIEAASTIASSYVEINQVQKAVELTEDVYRQIVMKDTSTVAHGAVDLSACGCEGLVFLAQLEHSLRRSSAPLVEILAALTTQYGYFSKFRPLVAPESSANFNDVLAASARLHHHLICCDRKKAAAYVFERFSRWFNETEAKRLNLSSTLSTSQLRLFLQSLLDYFGTHKSQDVVRSVGIMGNSRVEQLRDGGRFQDACDLALACFHYIAAHKDAYHTLTMAKLVLSMGMVAIAGQAPDAAIRKQLLYTSQTIVHDVLRVLLHDMKISLAKLDLGDLSRLIGLVGDQEDWPTLATLLTSLWKSREAQRDWPPALTFALVRRYILAQWAVGHSMTAVRTAEHIVYNCRRVHGPRHVTTLSMAVLLGKLYTGIAQHYQQGQPQQAQQPQDTGRKTDRLNMIEIANRYYKKAAALQENILRIFTDPVYASMDGGGPLLGDDMSDAGTSLGGLEDGSVSSYWTSSFNYPPGSPQQTHRRPSDQHQHQQPQQEHGQSVAADAAHVAQHLRLLKLAVQRLGAWPRDYSEYQRLSADVFRDFGAELRDQGVGGVETWNVERYGKGRAEADEDLLREDELKGWRLEPDIEGAGGRVSVSSFIRGASPE
ncbi:hypothetical protein B0I37DRAFT_419987 [Chaetomium sp. MPI-CAGE-AT-0009]|nr:hypothetical protein B0I37DRAFT_419987 [Chaetomium sp. MPI-CAGE-AT-0009]